MRLYEIVTIIDSALEDDQIKAIVDKIVDITKTGGGSLRHVDRWGRRRFAYEMADRWEGYYVIVEIEATPEIVAEINRTLSISDGVLRHKSVRITDKAIAARIPRPPRAPQSVAN
ncbi:MAG: 30S ribosomal protein S6 [Acidimicrobiaceae bacterium]|nr:30S ribosomal protein S6 [Acidimicrobiaceae bacterium]